MKKFIIHKNYTEIGTNYYEVDANSLEEAIEKVENFEIESCNCDVWQYENDFEDSFECDNKGNKI